MKLIIDIPEETITKIKDNAMFAPNIDSNIKWDITNAIVNSKEETKIERPHGKWIKCIDILTDRDSFTCSRCRMPNTIDKPYCPNCGAKMKGGETDD